MWKAETRRTYDRKGLRYPTDMTDAEWALARPFIDVPQRGSGRPRRGGLREVLNAVFYILGTGCQWRALPKDLPPRSTVHDYFVRWQCDGGACKSMGLASGRGRLRAHRKRVGWCRSWCGV